MVLNFSFYILLFLLKRTLVIEAIPLEAIPLESIPLEVGPTIPLEAIPLEVGPNVVDVGLEVGVNDGPNDVGPDIFTSKDEKIKGVFMYFIENGHPKYEYYTDSFSTSTPSSTSTSSGPTLTPTLTPTSTPTSSGIGDFRKWEESMMEKNQKLTWVKNIYWKLDEYSCVLVLRNKFWFQYAKEHLDDICKIIEKERIDGTYELRAPKKRNILNNNNNNKKKYNNNNNEDEELSKHICHISMETLEE